MLTAVNAELSFSLSGALPPGLEFDKVAGIPKIYGTITPAVTLDTITFDGSTRDFDLTADIETPLDPITFTGRKDSLDPLYFSGGRIYYLYNQDGYPYHYADGDEENLTITLDNSSMKYLLLIMTITGNQITFDKAMSDTGFNDDLLTFTFNGSTTYNLRDSSNDYTPYSNGKR